MKILGFSCFALVVCAATAFLAGCGGSQPPIGATGAMPQTSAIATNAERGKSHGDLVYATGAGDTYVLSYPAGTLVSTIHTGGAADCSDDKGNVFITNDDSVYEYSHGATSPIATLKLPGTLAQGCAVDPLSNNLAVVFQGSGGDIAIFADEKGTPSIYGSHLDSLFCGFDDSGNLFVDGLSGQSYGFSELPNGSDSFTTLTIDDSVGQPGQVQWDGKHITYEGISPRKTKVSQLSVSGTSVSIVGTILLKGIKPRAYESWIYDGAIIVPFSTHSFAAKRVGVWAYPKGGTKANAFPHFSTKATELHGVTISVGA